MLQAEIREVEKTFADPFLPPVYCEGEEADSYWKVFSKWHDKVESWTLSLMRSLSTISSYCGDVTTHSRLEVLYILLLLDDRPNLQLLQDKLDMRVALENPEHMYDQILIALRAV